MAESATHRERPIVAPLSSYTDVKPVDRPSATFVSLYAGAGGLDIGFALAGARPVWVSELDRDALDTHEATLRFLSESRPHLGGANWQARGGDILALEDDELPVEGSADLVIGGPPCQGFSVAGKMDPNDARSQHVFHFMDVVERVKPRAFLLENVKALYANSRWASIRDELVRRAQALGYSTQLTLANAADYGVPQARERMFLIGIRHGEQKAPVELIPTTAEKRPTVRDAFAELPSYGAPGNDAFCTAKITVAKAPVLRKSPFAGMLFNGAGRPLNIDAPAMTLPASMGGNKTPIVDQAWLDDAQRDSWLHSFHGQLWGRTANDSPVSADVPEEFRRITVQEAAALQTFPTGMPWRGGRSSRFKQIGNAVPPRLGLAAARAILRALGRESA